MSAIAPIDAYYFCHKDVAFKPKFKYTKHLQTLLSIAILTIGIGTSQTTASSSTIGTYVSELTKVERIIQSVNPLLNPVQLKELTSSVSKWSSYFNLDQKLVYAILHTESRFDPNAMSGAGAVGLMQVMVSVHADKMREAKRVVGDPNPFAIEPNVYMGTKILSQCKDKFSEYDNVLKCYNGSFGKESSYPMKVRQNLEKFNQIKL